MKMKTRIVNWIVNTINKIGLFTKNQYIIIFNINKRLVKENKELRKERNSAKVYINQLKENNKNLPFEFDFLISKYSKAELNALYYKMINHVRNNTEFKELLDIWDKRIKSAKEVKDIE
jgi:hypothetical protein